MPPDLLRTGCPGRARRALDPGGLSRITCSSPSSTATSPRISSGSGSIGAVSPMQSNLLLFPPLYLWRDEPKHYLRGYFNAFTSAFFPDTLTMCEHALPDLDQWRGDHFKTSDEANSNCLAALYVPGRAGRGSVGWPGHPARLVRARQDHAGGARRHALWRDQPGDSSHRWRPVGSSSASTRRCATRPSRSGCACATPKASRCAKCGSTACRIPTFDPQQELITAGFVHGSSGNPGKVLSRVVERLISASRSINKGYIGTYSYNQPYSVLFCLRRKT